MYGIGGKLRPHNTEYLGLREEEEEEEEEE
jgi:hypothetical protein